MKKPLLPVKFFFFSLFLFSCQGYKTATNLFLKSDQIRIDDMILEKSFIQHIRNDDAINTQAAGSYGVYGSQPWKKGIMPVAFSSTITQIQKDWFIKVAQKWSIATGVSIINRTNQPEYLNVVNRENGCFSEVGSRAGEIRTLNLGPRCWVEPTTLHEIGHALGLMHEHQRPDRNSYISIDLNNADPAIHYAFELFSTMNNATAYDFNSIMHYEQYAFSNNHKPTIIVLPKYSAFQNTIGIKKISELDRKAIAIMYAKTIAGNK